MKMLVLLIVMIMTLSIQTDLGTYTHEYKSELRNGHVSNVAGPVLLNYLILPNTNNVFEFNCSENGTIFVRMWDSENRMFIKDPDDERVDFLIVNDTVKKDIVSASNDCYYYTTLPAHTIKYESNNYQNLTIEISGDGNYSIIIHWRELEDWEMGKLSSYSTLDFSPFFCLCLSGVSFLIIGIIILTIIIIYAIKKKRG